LQHEAGDEITIEICATDNNGVATVVHRTMVSAINPSLARKKANRLLE
jgi:hypothetical protein